MEGARVTGAAPGAVRRAELRLARARERCDRERAALLDLMSAAASKSLERRPSPKSWAPLEILEHIALVEANVLRQFDSGDAQATGPSQGLLGAVVRRLPAAWRLALVGGGAARVQAPPSVHPRGDATKEAVLAGLRASRDATAAWLAMRRPSELVAIRRTHPLLGVLDGIDWIDFLAAHERRHRRQIAALLGRSRGR